MDDAFMQ